MAKGRTKGCGEHKGEDFHRGGEGGFHRETGCQKGVKRKKKHS